MHRVAGKSSQSWLPAPRVARRCCWVVQPPAKESKSCGPPVTDSVGLAVVVPAHATANDTARMKGDRMVPKPYHPAVAPIGPDAGRRIGPQDGVANPITVVNSHVQPSPRGNGFQ